MALLQFTYTASRPTTDLRADTFLLDKTISSPVLAAVMNDWNLSTTISTLTLVSEFLEGQAFNLDVAIAKPTITSEQGNGRLLTATLVATRPRTRLSILTPNFYVLRETLARPSVSFTMASSGVYELSRTISRPTLEASILNSILNAAAKTYTFNTMNSACTEYTNFNFNSYFKLGTKYYAIDSTGLWELTGNLDNTTQIDSEVATPVSSFDKQGLKACSDAIVLGRLEDTLEVQIVMDEQEKRTGHFVNYDGRPGLHRIRAKIPKGLMGATLQFKLKNKDGGDFSVNNLEVMLRELQRVR